MWDLMQRIKAHAERGRLATKWCRDCGATHKGRCDLVATAHGTFCRPELRERLEQRHADRSPVRAARCAARRARRQAMAARR